MDQNSRKLRFAAFWGCKIPYFLHEYEVSTRAVMEALNVELVDLEFNCCGYPVRELSFPSFLFSAARNLALAEQRGLDLFTPCKCCYGTLRKADYLLRRDPKLLSDTRRRLRTEGLDWMGRTRIYHLLNVLAEYIDPEEIVGRVRKQLRNVKVAAHYGCHALRPSRVTQFDNPINPRIFEKLIELTGAEVVDWPQRLDCCGNPLWEKNRELSLVIAGNKLISAGSAGADYLCTACTYCQMQFKAVDRASPTPILFPQLLGISFGNYRGISIEAG